MCLLVAVQILFEAVRKRAGALMCVFTISFTIPVLETYVSVPVFVRSLDGFWIERERERETSSTGGGDCSSLINSNSFVTKQTPHNKQN